MTSRRIETHLIPGPAGRLEALLEEPDGGAPVRAALVCHPHPKHGGTMHNKVVYRIARGLRTGGAVVLRFNFRGVNLSEGSYDGGEGEVGDTRAALEWLGGRYPGLPVWLAGFSFGSRIIQRLACPARGVERLIAAGFPSRHTETAGFLDCSVPRIFLQSTHDEYGPRDDFERFFEAARGDKRLIWIESRDHFFSDALDALEAEVAQMTESSGIG